MKFCAILLSTVFYFAFGSFNMFDDCPRFAPSRDIFIENVKSSHKREKVKFYDFVFENFVAAFWWMVCDVACNALRRQTQSGGL